MDFKQVLPTSQQHINFIFFEIYNLLERGYNDYIKLQWYLGTHVG